MANPKNKPKNNRGLIANSFDINSNGKLELEEEILMLSVLMDDADDAQKKSSANSKKGAVDISEVYKKGTEI